MLCVETTIPMLLDFGKHKGKHVEDTPISYILFLAGYRMSGSSKIRSDLSSCQWVKHNKKDIYEYATAYLQGRCWHCGTKLVPIGNNRSNGAYHDDWDGRYLHKACWKTLKQEEEEQE